jgi:hypothetical protein
LVFIEYLPDAWNRGNWHGCCLIVKAGNKVCRADIQQFNNSKNIWEKLKNNRF